MSQSKIYIIFPILLLAILLFFSCETKPKETMEQRRERMELAVLKKMEDRRIHQMTKCKNEAIAIAEKRVDSLLLAEAKMLRIDTTSKPIKPIKPIPPIVNAPKDSSLVKPLFEEILDTLN